MLGVPIAMIASLGRFAYVDHIERMADQQRRVDLACLAENVYHEGRGEPLAGQLAIAEVTMNRVASPLFPDTICEVVHEKRWDAIRKRYVGAFSWTELASLRRPRGEAWEQAVAIAVAVYDEREPPSVDGALFYHARYIKPAWAKTKRPIAQIGNHVFYR
jgi:spore germination cell wall hydrolase CwlJ-like protein